LQEQKLLASVRGRGAKVGRGEYLLRRRARVVVKKQGENPGADHRKGLSLQSYQKVGDRKNEEIMRQGRDLKKKGYE